MRGSGRRMGGREGGREGRKTEEHGDDLSKDVVSAGVWLPHCEIAPASSKESQPEVRGHMVRRKEAAFCLYNSVLVYRVL